jgi:L-seryl-tRNA(Ser) seleniumtransferase
LRPGSLVLGALQQTLLAYLGRDGQAVPFWRHATATVETLRQRAEAVVLAVGTHAGVSVIECESAPGGGSVPGLVIPSVGLALAGDRRAELRHLDPPVIARVHDGRTVLDLRSVDPDEDPTLTAALRRLCAQ